MMNPLQPIHNAADVPLDRAIGTLPLVTGGITDFMQEITFTIVVKDVLDFNLVEAPVPKTFFGCWQPMNAQTLAQYPEAQRKWPWYTLHAFPTIIIKIDDVIVFQGTQFRVMARFDWITHGYVEYHLQQDYTGAGP